MTEPLDTALVAFKLRQLSIHLPIYTKSYNFPSIFHHSGMNQNELEATGNDREVVDGTLTGHDRKLQELGAKWQELTRNDGKSYEHD